MTPGLAGATLVWNTRSRPGNAVPETEEDDNEDSTAVALPALLHDLSVAGAALTVEHHVDEVVATAHVPPVPRAERVRQLSGNLVALVDRLDVPLKRQCSTSMLI